MKKSLKYILSFVVLALLAGYFLLWKSGGGDYVFRTEALSRGEITKVVRATGVINPLQTVKVGSQVSGRIAELYVDFNSEVKEGQIVAVIDSTFLAASVREAEANLQRVRAQMSESERSLKRTQELFSKDLVAQAELDAVLTSYETGVAQMRQAEAALERAEVNLRYAVVRSPIDGVVISRDVDVGQTVAASLSAPQLFAIANDLKKMQVEASVDEADIGQIRAGLRTTFTVDSYPEEEFEGTVTQVRLSPVTVQNVVTYTVIIGVPNPDLKLRPGMTATASILIDKREDVLRLPAIALRFQPPADYLESIAGKKAGEEGDAGQAPDNPGAGAAGEDRDSAGAAWQRSSGDGGPDSAAPERRQRRPGGMRPRPDAGGGGMNAGNPGGGERGRMQWRNRGGGKGPAGHVWVQEADGSIREVRVKTGLSDLRYVELLGGELSEGDRVVLGATAADNGDPRGTTNPFQQQRGGGRFR